MLGRRALLAAGAAAVAAPAVAQSIVSDVADVTQPVMLDDRIARGYRRDVLIRWGDRVAFDAPAWTPEVPTAQGAASQFAWDARVVALVQPPPAADGVPRLVLVATHARIDPVMAFPAERPMPELEQGMVGASLVNLEFLGGRWVVVDGGFQARRLTATTLCRIAGPAAGHARLRTDADPAGMAARGLLRAEGGCATPWGTVLLAEGDATAELAAWRGGIANEANRFGWVVELDPLNPTAVPAKRTALGRFPKDSVAVARTADGRPVVYLTEARADGFLYRFVAARAPDGTTAEANGALLDEGSLAVAQVEGATLRWRDLPATAESLIEARAAAEAVGATPFDRPAGLAVHADGRLFLACRGNPQRGARTDALNPRPINSFGHVVELTPANLDHGAATAEGAVLILGGDPRQPGATARYGAGTQVWLAAPAVLELDRAGRLLIGTAQGGLQRSTGIADGIFLCGTRPGASRGVLNMLYAAPRAAAIGGIRLTPDGATLVAAVRTPGAEPGASFTRPATRWPSFQPGEPPRSTVIAIAREAGGPIGG
ncbi:alkaline phosphatase PhoX [Elioraea sp.]|uniref:PhoX family protein n=1 Tax=Elioraea sp. TaxID=2185103 RepID=UPI00307DC2DA